MVSACLGDQKRPTVISSKLAIFSGHRHRAITVTVYRTLFLHFHPLDCGAKCPAELLGEIANAVRRVGLIGEPLAGTPMFGLRQHDLGHIRIRSDFNGPFSESLPLSRIGARCGGDRQAVSAIALATTTTDNVPRVDTFLFGLSVPQ